MKPRHLALSLALGAASLVPLLSLPASAVAVPAATHQAGAVARHMAGHGHSRLVPTVLHAHQATINLTNGGNIENLWAHLEDTGGSPVEGEQIYFVDNGGRLLGIARTNSDGDARLNGASLNAGPNLLQEVTGGYNAEFRGGDGFARSTDHAAITVGTDCG
ncbi:hypothetical protein CTZ27_35665 [Streptomyces griseocarneus]|nr:hypothetical protein CTZ27_35665 [Streptomyces griseocarneus]